METEQKLNELIELEKQKLRSVNAIRGWVTFWGVLTVISLAGGALAGLIALISLAL